MEEQEDPTVSTTHPHGRKRNSSNNSESHTSKEILYLPKRAKYDDSESSENTDTNNMEKTSSWTENTLNRLQVTSKATDLLTISEIFSRHILPSLAPFNFMVAKAAVTVSPDVVNRIVENNCLKLLVMSESPLMNLDFEDVCDINISRAYSLMFEQTDIFSKTRPPGKTFQRKISSWNQVPPDGKIDVIENWFCQMFYSHGHGFTQQLINICLVQKKESPSESMFVKLFEEFAAMCGLLTLGQQKNHVTMKINNTKVTSVADIIVPYFACSDEDDLNILAVCEVKGQFEHLGSGSPEETRPQAKMKTKREKTTRHLDDRLLGQHGGDLLLNLPLTKRTSLAGIIIQRTNVTFSYLSCSQEKLEKIQEGRPSESSEIIYSRPYNFLKAADRPELMRALFTLAVIQLSPYL